MRQAAEQVQPGLEPAQDLLGRDEEADPAEAPQVADGGAAQVAQQRGARDEEVGEEDEDQRRGPGRDAEVQRGRRRQVEGGVRLRELERRGAEQQEDPYAGGVPVVLGRGAGRGGRGGGLARTDLAPWTGVSRRRRPRSTRM